MGGLIVLRYSPTDILLKAKGVSLMGFVSSHSLTGCSCAGLALFFAFAQFDAPNLTGDRLGQFAHKLDLARVFVGSSQSFAVLLKFRPERIRSAMARREHDERFDDFSAHFVG